MRGRGANLGNCLTTVKIIGFMDISMYILNKMKDNLGQECVKGTGSVLPGQN